MPDPWAEAIIEVDPVTVDEVALDEESAVDLGSRIRALIASEPDLTFVERTSLGHVGAFSDGDDRRWRLDLVLEQGRPSDLRGTPNRGVRDANTGTA